MCIHLNEMQLNQTGSTFFVSGLQLGLTSTIVISDVKLMREALLVQAENFSDRPLHLDLIKFVFGGNGTATHDNHDRN